MLDELDVFFDALDPVLRFLFISREGYVVDRRKSVADVEEGIVDLG